MPIFRLTCLSTSVRRSSFSRGRMSIFRLPRVILYLCRSFGFPCERLLINRMSTFRSRLSLCRSSSDVRPHSLAQTKLMGFITTLICRSADLAVCLWVLEHCCLFIHAVYLQIDAPYLKSGTEKAIAPLTPSISGCCQAEGSKIFFSLKIYKLLLPSSKKNFLIMLQSSFQTSSTYKHSHYLNLFHKFHRNYTYKHNQNIPGSYLPSTCLCPELNAQIAQKRVWKLGWFQAKIAMYAAQLAERMHNKGRKNMEVVWQGKEQVSCAKSGRYWKTNWKQGKK